MNDPVIEFFKKQSDAVFASQVLADIQQFTGITHRTDGKVAKLFPHQVREALIAASKIEKHRGGGDSEARTRAVDSAIRRAQRECPHLFNNEKE